MCVCHTCGSTHGGQRHWVLWNGSYRQLWASWHGCWELNSRASGRPEQAPHHRAISPALIKVSYSSVMFPVSIYLSCEDPWSDCLHLEERKGNTFMAEQGFISRSQCKRRHTLQFHQELKPPGQEAIDIKFWSRASWHLEKTRPWLWSLSM